MMDRLDIRFQMVYSIDGDMILHTMKIPSSITLKSIFDNLVF